MGILNIDLNIDNNFDADDPNTITWSNFCLFILNWKTQSTKKKIYI